MDYLKKILTTAFSLIILSIKLLASDDPALSVYQFSVLVEERTAYCWIPPEARQVKGIMIALSNLLERKWLEDPVIRKMAEREELAIIWVGPIPPNSSKPSLLTADMDKGAGDVLQKMLSDLSVESGYDEIAFAPLIPMGHSANGQFAWNVAAWNPARTIAAIAVKTVPFPVALKFQGIPICYMTGEGIESQQPNVHDGAIKPAENDYYWQVIQESALLLRGGNENNLVSVVTDPGGGQYDWSEKQSKFLALFISKACHYRLTGEVGFYHPVTLRKLSTASGWLTDAVGLEPERFSPASYTDYKGDRKQAYWFFDRELALAASAFNGDRKKRKIQLLMFIENGKPISLSKEGSAGLTATPADASFSFNVDAILLRENPAEFAGSATAIGDANGDIRFNVISGPAMQTGPSSFKVGVDRFGINHPIWIMAEHPGNDEYRRALRPAQMKIPGRLTSGSPQQVSFPFKQVHEFKTKRIELHASASSGLPVSYYVVAGPAYIKGNELIITKVPVWSKLPITITVVAYQYGNMNEPQFQTAEPAIAVFRILAPNNQVKHPARQQIIIDILTNYLFSLLF